MSASQPTTTVYELGLRRRRALLNTLTNGALTKQGGLRSFSDQSRLEIKGQYYLQREELFQPSGNHEAETMRRRHLPRVDQGSSAAKR